MSGIPSGMDFLASVSGYAQAAGQTSSANRPWKIGTIETPYIGWPGTLPKVIFDGESSTSGKVYPVRDGYRPVAGDRVVLAPVGTTYVIMGSLNLTAPGYRQSFYESARSVAGDHAVRSGLITDTSHRWVVTADGGMSWGPGGAAVRDTTLYRVSTGVLKTDGTLQGTDYLNASGNSIVEGEKVKTADQDVTNSATLTNDADLFFPGALNGTYRAEWQLFYSATATPNMIKIALTWPSGTCVWGFQGYTNAMGYQAVAFPSGTASGTSFNIGANGTGNVLVCTVEATVFLTGTAGDVRLQFAQQTAAASTLARIRRGSRLTWKRIA